jgi:hypothetical protein
VAVIPSRRASRSSMKEDQEGRSGMDTLFSSESLEVALAHLRELNLDFNHAALSCAIDAWLRAALEEQGIDGEQSQTWRESVTIQTTAYIRANKDEVFALLMAPIIAQAISESVRCVNAQGELNAVPLWPDARIQFSATALQKILKQALQAERKSLFSNVLRAGGDRASKADLDDLSLHYDAHIEDWKEAFVICRSALQSRSESRRGGWRDDVQRSFPGFAEHADLIERLQPMAGWPRAVANICIEKGGQDNPKDICLEYAARLCRADEYDYMLSSLKTTYRAQKRRIAK